MAKQTFTIGDLSKRAGVPVKTLRFYSDEGLLPPTNRSKSGYRIYSEDDLSRLDLIRTLREAGVSLAAIRSVLEHEMSLKEVLGLRLHALEAHILSLKHVAAAIRVVLRSDTNEHDLRRLHAVTRLSNEERKAVIEGFFDKLAKDSPIDKNWLAGLRQASTPTLPDEPTAEQLDAWIEFSEIISDPSFVESMRKGANETWNADFDLAAHQRASGEATQSAREAIARGVSPESEEAQTIAERLVVATAQAQKRSADAAFRASMLDKYENHDPRASRYWELVAILNGRPAMSGLNEEWKWLTTAILTLLRKDRETSN